MDIEQFRKAGYQAIDRICDYWYSLQDKPVASSVEPGYLRRALPSSPPDIGEDFELIADDYQKLIVPGLSHWQHPSFFAYFPTGSSFEGILAELYAVSAPNPGFNWSCSPACTELEAVTMDWAAQLLGLSSAFLNTSGIGGGVMQTSASDSCLTAVVAARSRYIRLHPDAALEQLVIYTTTQTHSLGAKAGLVLGLKSRALAVHEEDQYALRGETLRRALEEDSKAGLKPFILVATLGTTSSGAIDNMAEIKDVLQNHPDIWIHVDAAWAGLALSCPEYREIAYLDVINSFVHSFCTNFHKWGLTNFDASTLWVRDRANLTEALDITPEFLRTKHGDAGTVIDYRNWHLGLGRRFRSLKMWFILRSFGVEGFRKYIRKTIQMSDLFVSLIRASPNFALVTPPSFALSVFRLVPPAVVLSSAELNDLNRDLYARISTHTELLLTQTQLNDVFCIRMAVGSPLTEEGHIRKAFEIISAEGDAALKALQER
ncbi:hypothetical protein PLICRDRAFT_44310 [Plicaturopsis crispa FD-325 SS-3]|nr:hypothetical protein PLICRDRAFT_44310 [Plicaturopsis crispa FD-325 SS-3]